MNFKEYLTDLCVEKGIIDTFLDANEPNWAVFTPKVGYLLRDSIVKDGVDDSYSVASYRPHGERTMINYTDRRCRINTYGDSFTQCHQVNDAETWQEYLAGHFAEPIRNYGIGGFGVYQAYLRMAEYENNPLTSADYIVLNIFDDDHYRSIDKWRWIRIGGFREEVRRTNPNYFHANPWNHVRINPATGRFEEHDSICPTRESLYSLCEPDFVAAHFEKDFVAHCEQARTGGEFDPQVIREAADLLQIRCDLGDPDKSAETAERVHTAYALRSSEYIVEKAKALADGAGKKLMVVLSFGTSNIYRSITGQDRFDKPFVKYLNDHRYDCYDLFEAHQRDYRKYNLTPAEYLQDYFIWGCGHYNPKGNHFFAYDFKNTLVDWLEPKPLTYKGGGVDSAKMANMLA